MTEPAASEARPVRGRRRIAFAVVATAIILVALLMVISNDARRERSNDRVMGTGGVI